MSASNNYLFHSSESTYSILFGFFSLWMTNLTNFQIMNRIIIDLLELKSKYPEMSVKNTMSCSCLILNGENLLFKMLVKFTFALRSKGDELLE